MPIRKYDEIRKSLKGSEILLSAGPDGVTDGIPELSVHYIEKGVGEEVLPHTHHRTEAWVFLSGRGIMMVGDEIREVTTGDIGLAPEGSIHALKVTGTKPLCYYSFNTPPSSSCPMIPSTEEILRKWKEHVER